MPVALYTNNPDRGTLNQIIRYKDGIHEYITSGHETASNLSVTTFVTSFFLNVSSRLRVDTLEGVTLYIPSTALRQVRIAMLPSNPNGCEGYRCDPLTTGCFDRESPAEVT